MCDFSGVSKASYERVQTADGKVHEFHQSGLHSNDGFVYADGKRVYGKRQWSDGTIDGIPAFVAKGKHAWLVEPAPSAAQLALSQAQ